mgnify:CR=1 FL=1
MWVFTQYGMLSAVQDKDNPEIIVVRARRREHLTSCFPKKKPVHTPDADYHWRLFMTREEFASLLMALVLQMDYTNFKESVPDELYTIYTRIWSEGLRFNVTNLRGFDD